MAILMDLIKANNYTVEEFCKELKWDRTKLYRINKNLPNTKIKDMISICNLLNVNIQDIFKYGFVNKTYSEVKGLMELIYETEIKDKFKLNEQQYLVDILNGTLITTNVYLKNSLKLSILDANLYEQIGLKWNVDVDQLIKKIDELSEFAVYVLMKKVYAWWDNNNRDIDEIFI